MSRHERAPRVQLACQLFGRAVPNKLEGKLSGAHLSRPSGIKPQRGCIQGHLAASGSCQLLVRKAFHPGRSALPGGMTHRSERKVAG